HADIISNVNQNQTTINWTRGRGGATTEYGGGMTATRLTIFDTTLRDGEQAPGFSLRINEKLRLARQLTALGVDILEAPFPLSSEADAAAVRTIAANVAGARVGGLPARSPAA